MVRTITSRDSGGQCVPGIRSGGTGVAALFAQAAQGLAAAAHETEPAARFAAAYSAALRTAAAVLVSYGSPHRARRKPQSVWELLPRTAPELGEWAAYFAGWSDTHVAAQAGRTRRVDAGDAGEISTRAEAFLTHARSMTGRVRVS